MMNTLSVFVGPTAYGWDLSTLFPDGTDIRPPAKRGDVRSLLAARQAPGTIVLVDGTFHSHPSVGHTELRDALDSGWQVWGLSSMGAIRSAEMRHLGMRGHGRVYERYVANPEFDDDEVALVHEDSPPHRPLSEPMIHIRAFLTCLQGENLISGDAVQAITDHLKHRWYAERTLTLLRQALSALSPLTDEQVAAALTTFDRHRLKTQDLIAFAREQPWLTPRR